MLAGANDSLLETYEKERLPIAAAFLGLSSKIYQSIGKLSRKSLRRWKDERQLAITYAEGPLVSPSSIVTASVKAGDRAPNATFLSSDGHLSNLFEQLQGPQFTAIAYGSAAEQILHQLSWPSQGTVLKKIVVKR